MGVYLILRSPYNGTPMRCSETEDASILDWFRERWEDLYDDEIYGFSSMGRAIEEHGIPAPETPEALGAFLREHLYAEGEIRFEEHCLRVQTDDDECDLSWYLFDDVYLEANPGRAAFLLHEGWLPQEAPPTEQPFSPRLELREVDSGLGGTGRVYVCDPTQQSGSSGWAFVLSGTELDQLPIWLAGSDTSDLWEGDLTPSEIVESFGGATRRGRPRTVTETISAILERIGPPADASPMERELYARIADAPADAGAWAVYRDWLVSSGLPPLHLRLLAGRPDLPPPRSQVEYVGVSEHLVELSLSTNALHAYNRLILFDDAWAAAHPELARGLLRCCVDWDALGG